MPLDSPFDSLRGIRSPFGARRRGSTAFTPAALFASGEPGAWYDPSDLATLYQNSVGTVPVTADGDPVGLMLDKSQGLELGPELVTNGGFDTDTDWAKNVGWTIGGGSASFDGSSVFTQLSQNMGLVQGAFYEVSLNLIAGEIAAIRGGGRSNASDMAGIISTTGKVTVRAFVPGADGTLYFVSQFGVAATIDNISVRELPGNHATQSTSAARPVYRTDGTLHWLEADGVDDFLVRKSPAGLTAVSEVFAIVAGSADTTGIKGIFSASDDALGVDDSKVVFRPAGSTSAFRDGSSPVLYSYDVPASADFITALDVGSSDQNFRLNGSIVNQTTASTSGFTFGDSITIGASDDTVPQFWDGRFYGALLLGRRATSKEISDTETYFADKSGVTL